MCCLSVGRLWNIVIPDLNLCGCRWRCVVAGVVALNGGRFPCDEISPVVRTAGDLQLHAQRMRESFDLKMFMLIIVLLSKRERVL